MAAEKIRNYRKKAGLPPGSLVYTGSVESESKLDIFSFDSASIERTQSDDVEHIINGISPARNYWINITGLNNTSIISKLGIHHNIHPLLLEDVLNTESVPKIENTGNMLFICMKMLSWNKKSAGIDAEQISFIIGEKYLLSFQEREGDVFNPVRERLLNGLSKAREKGIDFLAYILIDKIIDNYFLVLEKIEDRIEQTEMELLRDTDRITPLEMMHLKKQLILLRKYVYPLRDEIRKLQRDDSKLIDRKTIKYINDLYDHLQNIVQNIEGFRDTITGLMELYSASLSNRMNSVMKTLTMIGAIFIPLTFIAGIYGMNFNYMPELTYPWAYPAVMLFMLALALGMFFYMKSRKWF
ncbi:Cobalt/magnesium transport protein CorA [bioreactor metagenome]|uniref:Cobalt/magnesium transport protein CorA n=1 Tax=bioreactor metagenome TaxID=1076179 RepID=A0A644TRN1_9ZZZZ|nr:magnesium/cobalt transporter CorA [Lentimicrobium sp.]MEA5108897.1 magnesium/cobalt transporter CorA [Lentimicrobium sp.]